MLTEEKSIKLKVFYDLALSQHIVDIQYNFEQSVNFALLD
jgi:hypothetical protein